MTEIKAALLVFAGACLLMTVAILGLSAANANEATLALGFIVPLILGSYGISRVVTHYESPEGRRR
jgi:hypothetical protein